MIQVERNGAPKCSRITRKKKSEPNRPISLNHPETKVQAMVDSSEPGASLGQRMLGVQPTEPDETPVPSALTKEEILKKFPLLQCFWTEIGWGYQMFWAPSKDGPEVLERIPRYDR